MLLVFSKPQRVGFFFYIFFKNNFLLIHAFIIIRGVIQIWLVYIFVSTKLHLWLSPQADEFIPWGCIKIIKVRKWTSSLLSPQLDEFIPWGCLEIIKSTSGQESIIKSIVGQVHPMRMPWNYQVHKWTSLLLSPQLDEFIIKSTIGRVHLMRMPWNYQVYKWTSLLSSP